MAMSPSTSLEEFLKDVRTLCRLEKDKDMTVKWVDEEGKFCYSPDKQVSDHESLLCSVTERTTCKAHRVCSYK